MYDLNTKPKVICVDCRHHQENPEETSGISGYFCKTFHRCKATECFGYDPVTGTRGLNCDAALCGVVNADGNCALFDAKELQWPR